MSALPVFALDGRSALVTGGNRGLGKAIAFALAESGARVVVSGRDHARNHEVAAEAKNRGFDITAVDADITDDESVAEMTRIAFERLGGLDILVNNAGACFHAPAFEVTDEEWAAVFDLNVRALWKCSIAAGAIMRDAGGGSIVNIGSISGFIVNRPQMQPAYNSSKAAVHQLTKSLAAEWAPLNIRVNAVAPGYIKTDMAPVDRPEFRRHWIEDAPQQRFARAEEIAPGVVFLASDAASFVTGSILTIDGGYTLW
ncbi:MAG TPA: glucose 1-dehydrogenase [Humibacter sp.]|jgi:NAD(P)-dependent dehydrogenase (short-subunit alcohol dehydrogenase family)|nr:glucose 1-dehydrogenase [Humibacter sp.]